MTRSELERSFGIDLDALNASFLQQLNAGLAIQTVASAGGYEGEGCTRWRPKPCLTGAPEGVGARQRFTVRFAVGGRCRFRHVWPTVSEVADAVLTRAFAHLDTCRSDHAARQAEAMA